MAGNKDKEHSNILSISSPVKKSKVDPSSSSDSNIFSTDTKNSEGMQPEEEKITWRGSPLCTLASLSPTNLNIPPVGQAPDHEVYVKLPLRPSEMPKPFPDTYTDIWSYSHVRMPNSPQSLYPLIERAGNGKGGKRNVVQRWLVIQEALQKDIKTVVDLKRAILSYNQRYEERWTFKGLEYLLKEEFCAEERRYFFDSLLPKIIHLALELPCVVTRPPVLLTKKCTRSLSLSQKQVACLLANAFLCTFPRRNAKGARTEYASYPDINFNRLFLHKEQRALEKMKCVIHYFKEVTSRDMPGLLTFSRQYIPPDELPEVQSSSATLSRLHIDSGGVIEEATGLLQVDFANKYIGGGILGLGCVQEEIRFALCPELILSRLFTEVLDRNEALVVTGVEQFSRGCGYASTFQWSGPYADHNQRDEYNRRLCQVVAVDALRFATNPSQQYKPPLVLRELHKAYVGFKPLEGSKGEAIGVASGNWGCGAFKGNAKLKGLIQIAAASLSGRDLAYFTFGDAELRDGLAEVHQFLRDEGVTVGQLLMCLCQYGLQEKVDGSNLFTYLYQTLSHYDSETDSEEQTGKTDRISPPITEPTPATTSKEQRKVVKTITDYFQPTTKHQASTSQSGSTSHRSKESGSTSSSTGFGTTGTKVSYTEEKILEALSECEKLVNGKGWSKESNRDSKDRNRDRDRDSKDKNRDSKDRDSRDKNKDTRNKNTDSRDKNRDSKDRDIDRKTSNVDSKDWNEDRDKDRNRDNRDRDNKESERDWKESITGEGNLVQGALKREREDTSSHFSSVQLSSNLPSSNLPSSTLPSSNLPSSSSTLFDCLNKIDRTLT